MLCRVFAVAVIAACVPFSSGRLSAEERRPGDFCHDLPQAARADCAAAGELLMQPLPGDEADLTVSVKATDGVLTYRYQPRNVGNPGAATIRECETTTGLILPGGASVRLYVTAADRIYTWQITSLGIKVDLIPGRINELHIPYVPLSAGGYDGRLSDESKGAVATTKVRVTSDARDAAGALSLQDFCGQ